MALERETWSEETTAEEGRDIAVDGDDDDPPVDVEAAVDDLASAAVGGYSWRGCRKMA